MINRNLFQLALDQLKGSQWEDFQDLAIAFLVPEYPELRTMAHPSGDGGRDGELFESDGESITKFEYSVRQDWRKKILEVTNRLSKTNPSAKFLVYLTNQNIAAKADELKGQLRKSGLSLDVRDRSWFLERANTDTERQHAAEQLIERIALPYLSEERVIGKSSSPLSSGEARAALLYLGLQWQDDITQKGLLSYLSMPWCALCSEILIQKTRCPE